MNWLQCPHKLQHILEAPSILNENLRKCIVPLNTRVMIQILELLTYESRDIIYTQFWCLQYRNHLWRSSFDDHNMFIVQATDCQWW